VSDFSTASLLSNPLADSDITAGHLVMLNKAFGTASELWKQAAEATARGDVALAKSVRSKAEKASAYAQALVGKPF